MILAIASDDEPFAGVFARSTGRQRHCLFSNLLLSIPDPFLRSPWLNGSFTKPKALRDTSGGIAPGWHQPSEAWVASGHADRVIQVHIYEIIAVPMVFSTKNIEGKASAIFQGVLDNLRPENFEWEAIVTNCSGFGGKYQKRGPSS